MYQAFSNGVYAARIFVAAVWHTVSPPAHFIWHILNTNFSAAMFGALGGALAAHQIATRSEYKKQLRSEIAGVNSAIALSNSISNTFVAMKRQHIMDMMRIYERGFLQYAEVIQNPPLVPTQVSYITDFRFLAMPETCVAELRQTILDRVQSCGNAISVSGALSQSITGLAQVLADTQNIFDRLKALPEQQRILAYYGLKNADGHIDERFPARQSAIKSYVDDGIYFPILLCEILTDHGRALARKYGRGAPRVAQITYEAIVESGLMPDRSEFPDFEKHFRPKPVVVVSWRDRVAKIINRD